ncbi:MAG: hypothetical protein BA869_04635 [Desulfuromonadales bacterium C00003107]|nr:MAG: hypothetical protein BA869_04635 [Desulfuromonadales bacterium C00003107]
MIKVMVLTVMIAALLAMPCAGDSNETGDNVVVNAADSERILLDYSVTTIDVVSMGAENYYVVGYKNVICGRGIVVFTDDGAVVQNESTVDSVFEAVAWREVVSRMTLENISTIKTLVGAPQAIETDRVDMLASCDSLAVLSSNIGGSNDTNYEVLAAFSRQILDVDEKIVEISNGTEFFLTGLSEHEKKVSNIVDDANSTIKSLHSDWKGRHNAQNWVFGALVLIVILLMVATALVYMRSKKGGMPTVSLSKPDFKLVGGKKTNIIDQLHSPDADLRARSALMAGASAEINESTIPHLIVLLDDVDDRVRANAAQSIRRIGQKNSSLVQFAKDPLMRHLNDPSEKVRDAVNEAYQAIGGGAVAGAEGAAEVAEVAAVDTVEVGAGDATEEVAEVVEEVAEPTAESEAAETIGVAVTAQLTDAQQHRLRELQQSVNRSMNDLPAGCDLCMPHYLTGICTAIAHAIEHAHGTESEGIDEMIDAAETACNYIVNLIENGRFIDVCISNNVGAFDDTGFVCEIEEYSDKLDALIRDPAGFTDSSLVEPELWELDSEITRKMGEFMIIPVSGLWKVSKSVFDDASDESGIKRAFMILISWIILGRAREMLRNPEIVRRLRL